MFVVVTAFGAFMGHWGWMLVVFEEFAGFVVFLGH